MPYLINPTALRHLLNELELSQRDLARGSGMSLASVNGLVNTGLFPARKARTLHAKAIEFLECRGASSAQIHALRTPENQLAAEVSHTTAAAPCNPENQPETTEGEHMLLPKQTLSDAARRQFKIFANPFDGEVTRDEEMYLNGEIRFVAEAAWQAAVGGRRVAIIGESGAGKTTVLDNLKEQINRNHKPVICIEPSVEGMEENDTRGHTMKVADIHAAILYTLDDKASVARGTEKRSRQVRKALEESTVAGNSHLLIIEEAHALPVPTLNHLKRLHEKMRAGRKPMIGILLMGHPELERKLSRYDVREVMGRMEIVRLRPLGADLAPYLRLRAQAQGRQIDEFIAADGVDELRSRLTLPDGPDGPRSLLYPNNINNWMIAALNTAAQLGAPRIDRDVVRAV